MNDFLSRLQVMREQRKIQSEALVGRRIEKMLSVLGGGSVFLLSALLAREAYDATWEIGEYFLALTPIVSSAVGGTIFYFKGRRQEKENISNLRNIEKEIGYLERLLPCEPTPETFVEPEEDLSRRRVTNPYSSEYTKNKQNV